MFCSKFSSIFEIQEIDPHGKKFDRVSRIIATSEQTELTLDVNTEIYPLAASDRLTLVLATIEGILD
jgi:DNA-directed RNA polymerase I, II, and III subunit RPABC3